MKKAFLLCLALILALGLAACGSAAPAAPAADAGEAAAPEAGKPETTTYDLSGKEENIDGLSFDGDVIVTGENGMLRFTNCTFNAKLINQGGEGAKVFVWEDCSFAEGAECVLDTSLEEATMDTDLPKFMLFCDAPNVVCEKAGAVVAPAGQAITLNGTEYPIDTAESFVNESTGDFAPFDGQEANMHNFAMWTENGEVVQMHVAIFTEE